MEKLPLMVVVSIIVIGLCSWVFLGDNGLNKSVGNGYDSLKTNVRAYGYKPEP
ncbi:hypothetical protein [Paenibacillus sp. PL91]|uniref:hypothetical protein n=1 Tax=Paenibacillus sp. PL91 TaxID=2729538 RepID=UPI00145E016A|nr:hypothetical protein [Paenibacillus sp. PL91]MBC9204739.1 hypothetical protein [Paenibacillus sp. PL91]